MIQRRDVVKMQADVVKLEDIAEDVTARRWGLGLAVHAYFRWTNIYLRFTNRGSSIDVMTKIHTDATTTALVVARPTPWVPPLVRRP